LPEVSPGPGSEVSYWDSDHHIGGVVVGQDELRRRVAELGAQITADYEDHPPLLVGVLKGAFIFTTSSGVVRIMKDVDTDLSGRHVLVVEDIVDSGITLSYLQRYLWAHGPATLEVCALLVKSGLQLRDVDLRYIGFTIPPDFVIGYGLDVDQRYRNLPDICVYRPDGAPGD
jgi:hypoxanthine phosphoribosyltransferase